MKRSGTQPELPQRGWPPYAGRLNAGRPAARPSRSALTGGEYPGASPRRSAGRPGAGRKTSDQLHGQWESERPSFGRQAAEWTASGRLSAGRADTGRRKPKRRPRASGRRRPAGGEPQAPGRRSRLSAVLAALFLLTALTFLGWRLFFSSDTAMRSTLYSAALAAARLTIPAKNVWRAMIGTEPPAPVGGAGGAEDLRFLTQSVAGASSSSAPAPKGYKKVKTVQFLKAAGTRDQNFGALSVENQTASHKPDIQKQLAIRPDVHPFSKAGPQVLILHTHITESYAAKDSGAYLPGASTRTADNSKNVCQVGNVVQKALEEAGVETLHDTGCYDAPDYEGAYNHSLKSVETYLKEHPSIQVVLDINRDVIQYSDGTRVKPTAVVGGRKAAQVLIVAPCEEATSLPVPDWQKNYRFGLRLQQALQKTAPGLARPLALCPRRYNMHVSPGALLVEVGTDVNTLDEAKYGGELLGKALAGLLTELKQ